MLVKNDLFDYENRYIYQDTDFFKFSLDSILLAEYVDVRDANNILDMCAGNMAIALILSKYTNANIVGFEIQDDVYKLGQMSIDLNNLDNQLKIINDDVNNLKKYYSCEFFDIMVCNPPFFKVNEGSNINTSFVKALARHELKIDLEDVFRLAKSFLKNNGCLYIVHRAERLDELFLFANKYQINIKKVQLISTKVGMSPKIVLIKAIKNAKPGVKIASEKCIAGMKTYKQIFKEEL